MFDSKYVRQGPSSQGVDLAGGKKGLGGGKKGWQDATMGGGKKGSEEKPYPVWAYKGWNSGSDGICFGKAYKSQRFGWCWWL